MKKIYLHILAVVIVGAIAYSNSFSVPFQFDDSLNITDNPIITDLGNFTSSLNGYHYNSRRYLGYLSLALNYRLHGLNVSGYHIVNFVIHIVNAILVYFFVILTQQAMGNGQWAKSDSSLSPMASGLSPLASRFTTCLPAGKVHDSRSFIALFSALLFVSHPVQTQAVTYIVQRFTSLATMFYLFSVVFYIKGRLLVKERLWAMGNRPEETPIAYRLLPIAFFFLSLVSAACAMKTKEIAFTLPVMILFYEFTFFKSTLKRKLVFLAPVLLTLAIIPLSMLHIDKPLGELLSDLSEKSRLQTDMSRGDYLMTEMRVIVTYIRLIFLPVDQNLDYDYPIFRSFLNPHVFLSVLFLSALFATAIFLLYKSRRGEDKERQEAMGNWQLAKDKAEEGVPIAYSLSPIACLYRLIAFGILWFFLALSVESSVIPIVDVIFEHRLYLPSVGAFVALSAALYAVAMQAKNRWPGAEKALIPLVLIIVLMLSGATFARNRVWQDGIGLWEDVVGKSPGNARAHNNLGFLYNAKGMNDQAIKEFLSALSLRPDYADARINLGIAYNAKGMFDQAVEQFMVALSMNPDDADAHNNLGISYVSRGIIDEGIKHYQIAISLRPDYAEAYNNLGVAYGSGGMFDQAKENFERAISLKPDYFEAYYNLALAYEKMGDPEKAAAMNSKARQLKPAL